MIAFYFVRSFDVYRFGLTGDIYLSAAWKTYANQTSYGKQKEKKC